MSDKVDRAVTALGGDGRIDTLIGDLLRGWYFNPSQPRWRADLDIIVDDIPIGQTRADRFRDDLLRDGKGDGCHAFAFKIPDRFFDDKVHNIYVRVAGTNIGLRRAIRGRQLAIENLPKRRGAISSINEDAITCYTIDEQNPSRTVGIDVLRGGTVVATPGLSRDIEVDGLPAKEFTVPIATAFGDSPFEGDISLVFSGTNVPLENPIGDLAAAAVTIKITDNDGRKISGLVRVPGRISNGTVDLYLRVHENLVVPLIQPEWCGTHSDFAFTFGVSPKLLRRDVSLSVHTSSHLTLGSPLVLSLTRRENLLFNPSFDKWGATGPIGWDLAEPVRAVATQGYATSSRTVLSFNDTASHTLVLRLKEGNTIGTVVSQDFDISGLGNNTTKLDVLVVAKASEPVDLDIVLTVEAEEDGQTCRIADSITVWTSWSRSALRLLLPNSSGALSSRAKLSIVAPSAPPETLQLALVMLGPAGFHPTPSEKAGITDLTAKPFEPVNAVTNAGFARWQAPLEQMLSPGESAECADGWIVKSRARGGGVRVALDRVSVRNPAKALAARPAYAIELSGSIGGGSVRLETELQMLALSVAVPQELSFFARTSQGGSSISKLFVVQSEFVDDDKDAEMRHSERIVMNVANRVQLSKGGSFLTFALNTAKAAELNKLARENIVNPKTRILLGIDMDGVVDCCIADVYFGPKEETRQTPTDDSALCFEDSRIAGQLAILKFIDNWAVTERVGPSEVKPQLARADRRWSRPSRDLPSIDIVVCVYNALDEVLKCLSSIVSNTSVPYTLTVIDDGSAPPVAAALTAFSAGRPWVRVKSNAQNLGYTRSANVGLAGSDAEWVVLLNSDTVVTPGWIEGMLDCARSDPTIRFVGPLSNAASWQSVPEIKDATGRWKVNQLPEGMTPAEMAEIVREHSARAYPRVPLLNGFCTMMEYRTLEELGFLDEQAFPSGYGEENDLCIRAAKAGYKLAIADDVYVFHSKSASFGVSQRQVLSKQGNQALASKHADIDIKMLETQLAAVTPVNDLRAQLKAVLLTLAAGNAEQRPISSSAAEVVQ